MLRERRRHANYKPNRRLDRKSSRGMIYENEELRLRTININAEVERGQSDIRKLRRENEQLKREIWSLRDEYEKVNKQMCSAKKCSSCENICNSDSHSEDSDSCEDCRENEACHHHADDNTNLEYDEKSGQSTKASGSGATHSSQMTFDTACGTSKEAAENYENAQKTLTQSGVMTSSMLGVPPPPPSIVSVSGPIASSSSTAGLRSSPPLLGLPPLASDSSAIMSGVGGMRHNCKVPASVESVSSKLRENLHVNFGQLSVLSEETLTNSDGASSVRESVEQDVALMMQSKPPDENSPISPLHEIQSIQPPLWHFENIPYEPTSPSNPFPTTSQPTTTTSSVTDERLVNPNDYHFPATHPLMTRSLDVPISSEDQQMRDSKSTGADSCTTQSQGPKHFFSPINPRFKAVIQNRPQPSFSPILRSEPYANPPDLFVVNALASPCDRAVISMQNRSIPAPVMQRQPLVGAAPTPPPPRLPDVPYPYNSDTSFYDGNLEDLLHEIETLQMQLEKHRSQSQEKLPTQNDASFAASTLTRPKPYRSEMNLVVSCDGCKSSITPITNQSSASLMTGFDYKSDTAVFPAQHPINVASAAALQHLSTNSSSVLDTPPPNLPQPMILFPQNLTYSPRDPVAEQNCGSVPVLTDIGFGAFLDDCQQFYGAQPIHQRQRLPAAPPVLGRTSDFRTASPAHAAAAVLRDERNDNLPLSETENVSTVMSNSGNMGIAGDPKTDSKSENSEAPPKPKKPEIKKKPTKLLNRQKQRVESDSSDQNPKVSEESTISLPDTSAAVTTENLQNDSSSSSDTSKRKNPRRISISFSDTKPASSVISETKSEEQNCDRQTEENTLNNQVTTSQVGSSLVNDLLIAHSKQNSSSSNRSYDGVTQSTPNSPQVTPRRTSSSASHHSHHRHHHHHSGSGSGATAANSLAGVAASYHHCSRKWSDTDSARYARKSSRRYSEGTVDALPHHSSFGSPYGGSVIVGRHHHGPMNFQETVGGGGGGGGGGSVVPPERNSNSFASSRESSTSQSTHHSQRRKISVSSHNGGKIPWCGCWGNGCL